MNWIRGKKSIEHRTGGLFKLLFLANPLLVVSVYSPSDKTETVVDGHQFSTSIGNRDRFNPNRLLSFVFTT